MADLHRKQLENLGKAKDLNIKKNDIEIKTNKDLYHLAEWDQKHVEDSLSETKKNEQNPDFLWTQPKDNNE